MQTRLIKSKFTFGINDKSMEYVMFHEYIEDLDELVNEWFKRTIDFSNVSLKDYLIAKTNKKVLTRAEAKMLDVKPSK